jgi:Ni/Fe-hydrogenase subunit HybB-like protein
MKTESVAMKHRLWTPWFTAGVVVIAVGLVLTLYRLVNGLGAVTNLNDGVPWGIWIAFDVVTGIALAAGGFTTAALVYIFNRGRYSPLVRPAVLTALLGYVIAAFSIVLDVGRWWQIYNPVLPANWQGNSPLFEVSLCVMAYATILILEFFPVVNERIQQGSSTFWKNLSGKIYGVLDRILFLLIILGVVVSTLHQSSLGSVVLIAKYRIDPLWWSPWLPLMFLVSAIAVGYPMVVIESWISSRAFGRRVEIDLLSGLARITPWVLGFYMILKVYDLIAAGEVGLLFASVWGLVWIVENLLFAVIPFLMLIRPSVRRSLKGLLTASIMMVTGLILNRLATYLLTYAPRPGFDYFPTLSELLITAMMIALLFVGYKVAANYLPVLSREH